MPVDMIGDFLEVVRQKGVLVTDLTAMQGHPLAKMGTDLGITQTMHVALQRGNELIGFHVAASWYYAGGGLNVYDGAASGLFMVGVGLDPLALVPVNNVVVLATWTAFIMAPTDWVAFYIHPFPGSVTFADAPGYIDGADVGLVVPCGVSSGYPYVQPVALLNNGDQSVVDSEATTWDELKAMYRWADRIGGELVESGNRAGVSTGSRDRIERRGRSTERETGIET